VTRRIAGAVSWDKALLALVVLTVVVGSLLNPDFGTASNLGFVVQDIGEVMLIALPMTFLIMTGEIDLSVASTAALSGCVLGWAWHASGSMAVACLAALGTGAVCGAVNGLLVTRLGLGSLAVTIGTLGLYRGLCYALLGDSTVADFPSTWTDLGYSTLPGTSLPYVTPLLVVLAIAFGGVLHLTTLGRWVFGIGQSAQAAHFAGVPVGAVKFWLFVATGTVSGLAGIVYDLRFASARPDGALGFELAVIASVLFGGVSIFGGVGTLWGVVGAVAFLGVLRSLLQLADVPPNGLTIITGGLLLASVVVPVLAGHWQSFRERRARAPRPAPG
jgi:rhamnose transport system permease protein